MRAFAHLEWPRPLASTCVPQAVLEQDVEQALDRPVFTSAAAARLHIRATIEDGPSGVLVRLEARGANGEVLGTRELRAPAGQCAALRNGIGLVLTLLVERDSEPEPLRLDAGLWTGFLFNVLPRGTFGAGPALSLNMGSSVQLRADAAYWLPVTVDTTRGIRAHLHAATFALRACLPIAGADPGVWRLQLCGGGQLGALITVQTRPTEPAPEARLLAQGLVEARGALYFGRTARLELALGPVVSVGGTSLYAVRSDGTRALLYRVPTWGAIFAVAFIISRRQPTMAGGPEKNSDAREKAARTVPTRAASPADTVRRARRLRVP